MRAETHLISFASLCLGLEGGVLGRLLINTHLPVSQSPHHEGQHGGTFQTGVRSLRHVLSQKSAGPLAHVAFLPSASLNVGLCPIELKSLHPAKSLSVSLTVSGASGRADWEEMTSLGTDKLLTGVVGGQP